MNNGAICARSSVSGAFLYGDETSAIAAYNAGHSNVDEWKDKIPDGDSISTEDIPFEETKNYVKKVSFAHDVYQKLYPNL